MQLLLNIAFVTAIVALIIINFKFMLLPNAITFPGIAIALLAQAFLLQSTRHELTVYTSLSMPALLNALIGSFAGALIGVGSLWTANFFYAYLPGREGIGRGDMKMMAMIGAYLGIINTTGVIFTGIAMMGGAFLFMAIFNRGSDQFAIPSGFIWGIPAIAFTFFDLRRLFFSDEFKALIPSFTPQNIILITFISTILGIVIGFFYIRHLEKNWS